MIFSATNLDLVRDLVRGFPASQLCNLRAAPVTQNHLSKPEDLILQNATLSGNERPDLRTSLMNMSLYCTCHAKCIFEDPLQMPHACHRFWKCCVQL